eukprot:COSAG01_NODE_1986_length_8712_cov_118.329618_3_plen_189_part_00
MDPEPLSVELRHNAHRGLLVAPSRRRTWRRNQLGAAALPLLASPAEFVAEIGVDRCALVHREVTVGEDGILPKGLAADASALRGLATVCSYATPSSSSIQTLRKLRKAVAPTSFRGAGASAAMDDISSVSAAASHRARGGAASAAHISTCHCRCCYGSLGLTIRGGGIILKKNSTVQWRTAPNWRYEV